MLKHKGYAGSVEYSEEDDCLYGRVLGMNKTLISYEGSTVQELKADFMNGVEQYLAHCRDEGIAPERPFTGTFNVRIPSETHGRAALKARERNQSLNSFVRQAIERELEGSFVS